jgi:hypothetical protein
VPALTEGRAQGADGIRLGSSRAWESPGAMPETRKKNHSHGHLRGHGRHCRRYF